MKAKEGLKAAGIVAGCAAAVFAVGLAVSAMTGLSTRGGSSQARARPSVTVTATRIVSPPVSASPGQSSGPSASPTGEAAVPGGRPGPPVVSVVNPARPGGGTGGAGGSGGAGGGAPTGPPPSHTAPPTPSECRTGAGLAVQLPVGALRCAAITVGGSG